MIIIISLLAVIALSEVTRLLLTHKKHTKKDHFKGKLEGTRKMIWDFEFKLFKTQELREEIRSELDFMKSRIDAFEKAKESAKKEDKPGIEDDITRATRDKERLEKQIQGLDLEINGSKPTNQYPDGVQGITSQIDALREVEGMLKSFLKGL